MTARTSIGLFSLVDHLTDPVTGITTTARQRLHEVVEQGVLSEALGFERFAVGEHHFCNYILPSPALVLSAIAARTSRVRLFTTVTLLALHDTIQLAEDIAVLDNLSDGRLELSFARGVSEQAGAAFGVPPGEVYQVMAAKLAELLSILGSGEIRPAASTTKLSLSPPTVQKPHPDLWIGGGLSPGSSDLAIEYALPLILPSLFRYPEDYLPILERYRDAMTMRGRADKIRVGLPSYCWVARDSQAAKRNWQPRMETYVRYAKNWRGGYGRALDFQSLLEGPAICGSPAEVVDRLARVNELLELDCHILLMDSGGVPFPELRDALELMGNEVLPQLAR